MSGDEVYSEVYSAFIEGELRIERERRTTIEARGMSVVTQSGGLVTLLTGAGAVAKGAGSVSIPLAAIVSVIVALAFFFGAAACGILVNFLPKPYTAADDATMTKMRTDRRGDPDDVARSVVSHIHIGTLDSLRTSNNRRLRWVARAQFCQMLGLVAVSAAVGIVIMPP